MNHSKEIRFFKLSGMGSFVLAFLTSLTTIAAPTPDPTVSSSGNLVHVQTPREKILLFGDPGFEKLDHYSFSLPYENPEPQPTPSPETPSEKTVQAPDVKMSAEDLDFLLTKANGLYNKKNYLEALTLVEQGIRHHSHSVRAWAMRGSLMHTIGNREGAIASWQKGLELDPHHIEMKQALDSMLKNNDLPSPSRLK